jgi:predicted  nucleic acid-binding Zn-ribbon protein
LNPQLTALVELQALDLRISEIREHTRKIPAHIQAAEATLKETNARLRTVTASVEALTKERRDRERDLDAHESQVAKLRGRLAELKTNKEYQAHLFEIEMANKKKGEIEEQILAVMERIEQLQEEVKREKAKAAEAERAFAQEKVRLEATVTELESELTQLDQKQKQVSALTDRSLLDRYNKLKAGRKDLAVVPIRNGICGGCRLQLPPQLVAEVKRSNDLLACSYCQRILYWDGEPVSVSTASSEREEPEELDETS